MATRKQRAAAKRNVEKAQAGAKRKQSLKNLPRSTKTALGKEGAKVRAGAESRADLYEEAKKLDIPGRSKMGKEQLRRAIARRR